MEAIKLNSFYTSYELNELGLANFGENALISRKVSIYSAEKISIGNNVRIDDFCILSGKIIIGNYIHIAAYTALYGGDKGIVIQDFANISSRISIYSISDDYSGETMTNPMIPDKFKNIQSKEVIIERHVIIGSGCVVLPGAVLKEGSSFGAMTFINKSSEPWSINVGIPFKKIKDRSKNLLNLKENFKKECLENMNKQIQVTRSSMPELEEYIEEIKSLWESHWLTNMGTKHKQLEVKLLQYLNTPNITLFTNGHLALECAIVALNLTGEVITTPFTFASTTHAIVRNGLEPVFCDINPDDYTIDVDKLESLVTEKTSAIIPTHVYGNICNIKEIERIAKKHNLKVIYDAAHAFGVTVDEIGVSNFGDASMFSFHATKVFNTIEGGAVTFKDSDLRKTLNDIKNFGITGPESVEYVGGNAKMNEFQAAMGICNIRHVDSEIEKRKVVVERYFEKLGNVSGIKLSKPQSGVKSNYAYFPVVFDGYKLNRDEVAEKLKAEDIYARKYFYPLTNSFECYKGKFDIAKTPIAKHISDRVLALPLYADLALEDVDRICDIILNFKELKNDYDLEAAIEIE